MLERSVIEYLLPEIFNAAVRAGAQIMKIYKNRDDYDVSLKSDQTPITVADRLAHETIKDALGRTRIPILSEEGREMSYQERCNWDLFWLVDPLDGTVEFIKGNNEFTVNIALMEHKVCQCSVTYVPYLERMYVAMRGVGAFRKDGVPAVSDAVYSYSDIASNWSKLPLERNENRSVRVALSRSHQTPETQQYVDSLREQHPDLEVVEQGSSYKFCLLAEGDVDYYVRTSSTYEWDTAAGELILAESGGATYEINERKVLSYNKEDLRNPWFVSHSCYYKQKD